METLASLRKLARRLMAGLPYIGISVSNDLDSTLSVALCLLQGAPIDAFGVGTKLATCDPQPSAASSH